MWMVTICIAMNNLFAKSNWDFGKFFKQALGILLERNRTKMKKGYYRKKIKQKSNILVWYCA